MWGLSEGGACVKGPSQTRTVAVMCVPLRQATVTPEALFLIIDCWKQVTVNLWGLGQRELLFTITFQSHAGLRWDQTEQE